MSAPCRRPVFRRGFLNDFMDFPFREFERDIDHEMRRADKQLYGRKVKREMKTAVHETDTVYEIDMGLPGFKKAQIHLELQNGYLTITASKGLDKDEKTKSGKLIRQERYVRMVIMLQSGWFQTGVPTPTS